MKSLMAAALLILSLIPSMALAGDPAPPAPVGSPVLKFSIPEHDLYPENIAWDSKTGDFLLGSMGRSRIIRIRADGTRSEFLASGDSGLLSSVGMKADAERRRLWVCSGRFSLLADCDACPAETGVFLFDLDSGKLVCKWTMPQESPYHIFNDLALDGEGNAYATTTMIGALYRLSPGNAVMELVHQLEPGRHNNGIAFDPLGKSLFIAVDRTISRLELATGNLAELPVLGDEDVGTDGLYFYGNSLISVKPRFNTITRIFLEPDLFTVRKTETLVRNHPDMAYPTTGVLAGEALVYVATSYANVPRNPESARQHGDVLIHQLALAGD